PPPCSPLFPYTTLFRSPTGRRAGNRGRSQAGDADCLLPLGLSHLGNLRPNRPGTVLFLVPPRLATVDAFGALSDHRRTHLRTDRSEEHTSELQSRENLV